MGGVVAKGLWCMCKSWGMLCACISWLGHLVFNRVTLLLALLLAGAELWLETCGLPETGRIWVLERLSGSGMPVSVKTMRLGMFRGVQCHDVAWEGETAAGRVRLHAEWLQATWDWTSLFSGKLRWTELATAGTTVCVSGNNGEEFAALSRGDVALRLDDGGRLEMVSSGAVAGVQLQLEATFADGEAWLNEMLAGRRQHVSVPVDETLAASIQAYARRFREIFPEGSGSQLHLALTGDLTTPENWAVRGHFAARGVWLSDIGQLQGQGQIAGTWQCLEFSELRLQTAQADEVRGQVKFYGSAQEMAAAVTGKLGVAMLARLFPEAVSSTWQSLGALSFAGELERCSLTLPTLRGRLSAELPRGEYGALGQAEGSMTVSVAKGMAQWTMQARLQEHGGGRLQASGQCELATGRFAGKAELAVRLARWLKQYGVELPRELLSVSSEPCQLDVSLTGRLEELETMVVEGRLTQPGGHLLGVPSRQGCVPFRLADGMLEIAEATVWHGEAKQPLARLRGRCDLAAGWKSGRYVLALSALELAGVRVDGGTWGRALLVDGEVCWRPTSQTLSFAVKGESYPQRLHQTYLRHLAFDRSQLLKHIDCEDGTPLRFSLSLPETATPDAWRLQGDLQFGRVQFNGVTWEQATCPQFEISAFGCDFRRIFGRTAAGDEATFDLHVAYAPMSLSFTNAVLRGDPRVVGAFLMHDGAQRGYLQVFQNLSWGRKQLPTIRMPRLTYESLGDKVICEGMYIHAQDVRYRALELDEVNVVVSLDVPHSVTIEPATVHRGEWMVTGKVRVELTGTPECRFEVYRTQFGLDVPYVLQGIWPEHQAVWRRLRLGEDSELECVGSVICAETPVVKVRGRLQSSAVSFDEHRLDGVDVSWSFAENELFWDVHRGTYASGEVQSTGRYSLEKREGEVNVRATSVSLSELQRRCGLAGKTPVDGGVSGECQVRLLHGWGGQDWQLTGRGKVSVRGGELWNVPVLSSLLRVLQTATLDSFLGGLGRITSLDMELLLEGNRIRAPRVVTDGTIVSLEGHGQYEWTEKLLDGQVQAEVSGVPVRNVRLLSWMLSPVTGLFQAELSGPLAQSSWRLRTFLGKLF